MTRAERQQSLANARRACRWLCVYVDSLLEAPAGDLLCLVAEFERLDAGEQKRNAAGRASGHLGAKHGVKGKKYGAKGGRPKGAKK